MKSPQKIFIRKNLSRNFGIPYKMTVQKMNEKNETKRRTFDPLEEPTAELALLFICIVMSHITHLH